MPASGHRTTGVFTALSSRRIWSLAEKRSILAEMAAPGAIVMEVARRRGIAQSLLYRWRSDAVAAAAKAPPAFLPVTIEAPAVATPPKTGARPRTSPTSLVSIIEIDLGNGRTLRATTDIEASALVRIVAALESKS